MYKPYTVLISEVGGWWSAICPELCVSGFGGSKQEAVEAVVLSMRSTISLFADMLSKNPASIRKLATITV